MRASNSISFALAATLVVACSPPTTFDAGGDASSTDTGATDASTADHTPADANADARTDDALDASTQDTSGADSAGDGAETSTGDAATEVSTSDLDVATDAPVRCDYIDSPSMLAYCTGTWTTIFEWVNTAGATPACPPYFTAGTTRAPSVAELVTALGCADACVWRAAAAVSFLHCGHRDEYTSYQSDDAACDPIMMFSNGVVYASIDDYDTANPCPP